jgi:hypothetical protein
MISGSRGGEASPPDSNAEISMRTFPDESGSTWHASVRERQGTDYKGRFYFVVWAEGDTEANALTLPEIRWNTRETAERTLQTMSDLELRRRLRSARGRESFSSAVQG